MDSRFWENLRARYFDASSLAEKPLVLFGASKCGRDTLEALVRQGINVSYFCDNDPLKHGCSVADVPVISPQQLYSLGASNVNVMITSSFIDEIGHQLFMAGFTDVITTAITDYSWDDHYSCDVIWDNRGNIEAVLDAVNDTKSREVLLGLLEHRFTRRLSALLNVANIPRNYGQYFLDEIFEFTNHETMVDGGAYCGDTVAQFLGKIRYQFSAIYAFEPDTLNYNKLQTMIHAEKLGEKVFAKNAAIFSKNACLNFKSDGDSSHIMIGGHDRVDVIRLDDFLKDVDVSFIKMDIEGAEKEALLGAKNIICTQKPKMAICIYHKPADLWEIPLLLKSLVPEYKMYIRHWGQDKLLETVCYVTL